MAVFVAVAACEEKTGVEALPTSLRPVPSANVQFYKIGSLRCPYWLEPFESRDGKGGGNQCVGRAVLREICVAAECKAMPGAPEHRIIEPRE